MKRWLTMLCMLPFVAQAAERPLIPAKSEIGFVVTQMGVGVSGHFREFNARIDLRPEKPESSKAGVEVVIASIATGEPDADAEAVAKPWLDAAAFPKATFMSTAVRSLSQGKYEATGLLSIKGKTREIKVPLTLENLPDGTALVAGEITLRRTDFGIGGGEWNKDDLVANEVPVRFRLTLGAVPKQTPKQTSPPKRKTQ